MRSADAAGGGRSRVVGGRRRMTGRKEQGYSDEKRGQVPSAWAVKMDSAQLLGCLSPHA